MNFLEWLAPVATMIAAGRMLIDDIRALKDDSSALEWLKLGGLCVVCGVVVSAGFEARGSVVGTVILTVGSTAALLPARVVLRLIRARRPNEIEDPEYFAALRSELPKPLPTSPTSEPPDGPQQNDP